MLFQFVFPAALDEFISEEFLESSFLSAGLEFLLNEGLSSGDVTVLLRGTAKNETND